jgi:hypothetical protein
VPDPVWSCQTASFGLPQISIGLNLIIALID